MSEQLPDVSVWMINRDLSRAPQYTLPEGYRMRFYRDGDLATWVRVQQAAERHFTPTADHFARSMPGETPLLATRVMFLVDPSGADIGTITAWDNATLLGRPIGQIHWVAIVPSAQGRGLAKPMLGAACGVLRSVGHAEACLDTSSCRIPALNLYLHFGFAPYVRSDEQREAWRAVAPHLRFPVVMEEAPA